MARVRTTTTALLLATCLALATACSQVAGGDMSASDGKAVSPRSPGEHPRPQGGPSGPTALRARTFSVVMSGDLLWHTDVIAAAEAEARRTGAGPYDFRHLFQDMAPLIGDADVAICHEEVPFAPDGEDVTGYPVFGAPQQVADAVADTGWDLCTTSSNHSLDRGWEGLATTLRELDRVGVAHTGTFRSPEERARPTIVTTENGVKVAVVSGTYGTNGIPLPEGREWSVALLDQADLLARARAARQAGADVVLVAVHAGQEYEMMPDEQQISLSRALTASPDVDLVYGHHVHVVQPWERINGKWVVHGLGNMVANHETSRPRAYEGVTARFEFTEKADGRFEVTKAQYVPTMVTVWWNPGDDLRVWPVVKALATGQGEGPRLEEARARVSEAVHALGENGMEER
ncbi:CapA family protein [Schaalia sp. 19OD2882]|uniref:CapA family protein n=1 Tax=Schaalia sp. 19OD2882 TaxID=2794089 RepID=UPI001C1EF4D9|nr:CapA family protein [Schaalia sp. 19OD2882]QWW19331.1 CapA family protein [Schaalia sp. 19OD2882]